MFKAKKKNPKQKRAFRKKEAEDDEDDNNNQNNDEAQPAINTAETIARIKKKRKFLTELQYKKGTDTATLLKGRMTGEDPQTALAVAASGSKAAADPASSSQEGIMEQKHKQALEQYVESKLADMVGDKNEGPGTTTETETNNNSTNPNNKNLTKEELYKQLAQSSETLAGRTPEGNSNTKDGDVGTGGAMLVAGTGLAEVILPVEERLKAVQATQEASSGPQARNKTYFGMPTSQVPVPAGAARFQVSGVHRHFPGTKSNASDNNNPNKTVPVSSQQEEEEGNADQNRVGFDASRGKATTGNTTAGNTNPSSNNNEGNSNYRDNKNRASDDKVYGNFLKHHRENQWRGGR